ncbi:MAG: HAMP domain-containing histidine kinase [Lachnospiraceae bacterium]|nr:HAMP domain-containing histidine kinase [Lachnospiraceae bacterium]
MRKIGEKIRNIFSTLNLTMLLVVNLFFIVFLMLALVSLLVFLGVDNGFFIQDGALTIRGGLVFIYAVCILTALSMVVMIRLVFIVPIQEVMDAMKDLASGNFSRRIKQEEVWRPREIVEFRSTFNKTAEQLEGTEILRKDFISNFSHEFKTPIVSISGFADLLMEDDLTPEERKEYLSIIHDESIRLADLSARILAMSRIESQTVLTDCTTFRLDEQIRQCVLVSEQKWKQKALQFDVTLGPAEYYGNESMLKEVWLNLLDNAAKFSEAGGLISITLTHVDAHNALNLNLNAGSLAGSHNGCREIAVAVTDHGPGMDEETKAHIFDQFYQGDTSHKTQGNGLGLSMVRKIVSLHEGRIEVDSSPGNGSCFTVYLKVQNQ